jgi:hypothetical protein
MTLDFCGRHATDGVPEKIGVSFGARDVTLENSEAAKWVDSERRQLAQAASSIPRSTSIRPRGSV